MKNGIGKTANDRLREMGHKPLPRSGAKLDANCVNRLMSNMRWSGLNERPAE